MAALCVHRWVCVAFAAAACLSEHLGAELQGVWMVQRLCEPIRELFACNSCKNEQSITVVQGRKPGMMAIGQRTDRARLSYQVLSALPFKTSFILHAPSHITLTQVKMSLSIQFNR